MTRALEQIQEWPREPGETAIPEIGTIVKMVEAAGIARRNRESNGQKTTLVGRQCACGYRCGGFVDPNDYKTRYCQRCGKAMSEIHRESLA